MKDKPVVVTTEHKGVFFGLLVSEDEEKRIVRIENARNCIYWCSDVNGFMGLATTGPISGCKIGPTVPTINLYGVTSVIGCTGEASEAWTNF